MSLRASGVTSLSLTLDVCTLTPSGAILQNSGSIVVFEEGTMSPILARQPYTVPPS
jgi:hypothetical protein